MDFVTWIKDGWVILAAIIAGITLVWNFINKTLKEIGKELSKPIDTINEKIDSLSSRLNEVIASSEVRKRALLALQRKSILDSCDHYIRKGYARVEEKETVYSQFKSYQELGGNSFVKSLVDQVEDLPLEKQEKTKKKAVKE